MSESRSASNEVISCPVTSLAEARRIADLHPRLPGLRSLLWSGERDSLLAPLTGGDDYVVARMRLKSNRSLSMALRPRSGEGPWLLAIAVRPEEWGTKAAKQLRAIDRAGGARVIDPEAGLVIGGAHTDRDLHGLCALAPDLGAPVTVAGVRANVRTLSYNPGRRWVGVARPLDGSAAFTARLTPVSRTPVVQAWIEGRTATAADLTPQVRTDLNRARLADLARGHADVPRTRATDLPAALARVVTGLGDVRPAWSVRGCELLRRLSVGEHLVALTPAEPAHGDLSLDQIVLAPDGRVHVIDWDRIGWYPTGWDDATLTADRVAAGALPVGSRPALLGPSPAPAVLATAALMRAPDPFRRQMPGWADATDRLLDHATEVLS